MQPLDPNKMTEAALELDKKLRVNGRFGLAFYCGGIEAALRECSRIEKALCIERFVLRDRLEQMAELLGRLLSLGDNDE